MAQFNQRASVFADEIARASAGGFDAAINDHRPRTASAPKERARWRVATAAAALILALLALHPPALVGPATAEQRTGAGTSSSADEVDERITLVVPGGAGGGTDALARRLALLLGEPLGAPVVVINQPGRDGLEALETLRSAAPDGLTLGVLTGHAARTLARPAAAITPILLMNVDPPALHVRAGDDPGAAIAASMRGAAEASGGPAGSLWHLALAALAHAEGGRLPAAAWRPAAQATVAIEALERGDVRLVVAEAAQGAAARRAGAITTTGGAAAPPAAARHLGGWRGLVGPPGMSKKRAEQIAAAARLVTGSDAFRRFLRLRGYTPADLGPAGFTAFLESFAAEVARARAALN